MKRTCSVSHTHVHIKHIHTRTEFSNLHFAYGKRGKTETVARVKNPETGSEEEQERECDRMEKKYA